MQAEVEARNRGNHNVFVTDLAMWGCMPLVVFRMPFSIFK